MNEEKVDIGDTKVDIQDEKVDIEKVQVLPNFFPIWYRQILLNQYPVTEKENINSRSSVYLI